MRGNSLRALNVALVVLCVVSTGHLIYRWDQVRPRVVFSDSGPECTEALDSDAHYLALLCQAVIESTGSLPEDRMEIARVIAQNASTLGFTWPNNFSINKAGQISDCAGNPFEIRVLPDRVAVTSDALYGYYFAGLKKPTAKGSEQ